MEETIIEALKFLLIRAKHSAQDQGGHNRAAELLDRLEEEQADERLRSARVEQRLPSTKG